MPPVSGSMFIVPFAIKTVVVVFDCVPEKDPTVTNPVVESTVTSAL